MTCIQGPGWPQWRRIFPSIDGPTVITIAVTLEAFDNNVRVTDLLQHDLKL